MRRTNGTASTLVHNASWSGANAGGQAMMHGIMQISANDTVDFQCVRGDSNTHGWGTTTLDGEATVTSSITISKIQ
jgi:hypothetical protein